MIHGNLASQIAARGGGGAAGQSRPTHDSMPIAPSAPDDGPRVSVAVAAFALGGLIALIALKALGFRFTFGVGVGS